MQGFYARYTPFRPDYQWVVSANVTDKKLAVILQIFDAVSFDPELYVLTNFGTEGVDFIWEGIPFHSRIIYTNAQFQQALRKGVAAFRTGIMDDRTGKIVFRLGDNALTQFASSNEAARLAIRPFINDIFGLFTEQRSALDIIYQARLQQIKQEFYYAVINGQITDVDAEWDRYIANLNANGLLKYIELFEQF